MRTLVSILTFVLLLCAPAAPAQTTTSANTPAPPAAPLTTPTPGEAAKPPALKVVKVSIVPEQATTADEKKKEADRQEARRASLGDSIVLTTSPELGNYLDYAVKQKKAVTLFLDGNDTGISPEVLDRKAATLQFHLERNADNKKVWMALLRDPFHHPTRKVEASIGLAGGTAALEAETATFTLIVMYWAWYAWAWLLLLIVLLGIFGCLVVKYDILRDGPKPHPYSLGRCQMAWWFFLINVSYVTIWLISGDQDTITPSLLTLMGISAATALGAVAIDATTNGPAALSQAAADRLALQASQQNAKQTVAAAEAVKNAAPTDLVAQKNLADAQAASAVVDAKLLVVNNRINGIATVPQTRGFLRDILSDSQGTVGLHRFQIVVWTIVLGIIFVVSVTTVLSMPEFSATLLAAMGISAGTYLGFKFPEK